MEYMVLVPSFLPNTSAEPRGAPPGLATRSLALTVCGVLGGGRGLV
jgi:hypothetical protein